MPGGSGYMETDVLKAVQNGTLPESTVNASARRVLELVLRRAKGKEEPCDHDAHHALARQAAEAGAVLLKNEGESFAPCAKVQKSPWWGLWLGRCAIRGAGSSHINPLKLSQPLDFLPGATYAPGCDGAGGYNPGAVGRSGGCGARRRGGGGVCRFAGTV